MYTELLLYLKERINLIYNINRTGENVYEIPETEKYVGSYDTAVNPKDLKRTVGATGTYIYLRNEKGSR